MTELETIENKLSHGWANDVVSQQDYLFYLSTYKSRINSMRDEAEKLYNNKLEQFINQDNNGLKQYEYNDKRSVFCRNELELIHKLDRLSGTIETQCKSLITLISFAKEEMKSVS